MNPCAFIIFSLFLLHTEATTANPLTTPEGGNHGDIINKCRDKERNALLLFKAQLQDPQGLLSTWRADEDDCCSWFGVTCNNQTGHVTGLDIGSLRLEGQISNSLLNLSYMNHLDLSTNSLHGTIPIFIGSMTRLSYLDLSFNNLNGTIPTSIGSLTELKYLSLTNNSFYGTIPHHFGNLTKLQTLSLGDVGICRVDNLQWLSHLSHLEELRMDGISLAMLEG